MSDFDFEQIPEELRLDGRMLCLARTLAMFMDTANHLEAHAQQGHVISGANWDALHTFIESLDSCVQAYNERATAFMQEHPEAAHFAMDLTPEGITKLAETAASMMAAQPATLPLPLLN